MSARAVDIAPTYRRVLAVSVPVIRWWGRLEVTGLDAFPDSGPVIVLANHDSHWDPLAVGVAALPRRQVRALAKSSLWKNPVVAKVLDGMGQVPIERGRADSNALAAAIEVLREGGCIGIFPEGTISHGRNLRAQSGAGRLVHAVPETTIVCCRILGTPDIVRAPLRPRIRVEFFRPAGGPPGPDETAMSITKRGLAEIREQAPPAATGRKRVVREDPA